MNHSDSTPSIWQTAQQKCWTHVEMATSMMRTLSSLEGLHVNSVIPIMSDTTPTLMIVPELADDLVAVRATCRFISTALQTDAEWKRLAINDEWVLRLQSGHLFVDVLTRLPATKESPIEV